MSAITEAKPEVPVLWDSLAMCLRTQWDAAARDVFAAAVRAPRFDWAAWLKLARHERIAPILYGILRDSRLVPPHVEEQLSYAYFANLRRNGPLLEELRRILREFSASGFSAIALKGAALAGDLYGDPALRPMSDLDVLVREHDFPAARRILERMGYESTPQLKRTHPNPDRLAQVAMYKSGRPGAVIELHQALLDYPYDNPATFPAGWFWSTAEQRQTGGVSFHVLGPSAQLLYLAGHLFVHHWAERKLLWLHDVAMVIHRCRQRIDWDEVAARAMSADLVLPLQAVLPLIVRTLGVPVPEHALQAAKEAKPSRNERRLFLLYAREHAQLERLGALYFYINLRRLTGWRAKCRYLREALLPAADVIRRRHRVGHPILLPVFYARRLARGAWSAGRAAWVILRTRRASHATGPLREPDPPVTLSISSMEFGALAAGILGSGASLRCRVHGSSMKPFLRDNDILTVASPTPSPPRIGDVVLYRSANGQALLHRVIDITERDGRDWLTVWGDAAAGILEEVGRERVLGVAVALERGRHGRRIRLAPPGWTACAWCAIQRVRAGRRPRARAVRPPE
jgi:hypothetical protein